MKSSKNTRVGIIYGALTYTMWGLFPVYFKLLENVNAMEVLAHRVAWSVVTLFIFIKFSGRLKSLAKILHKKKLVKRLLFSGFFITLNWGIYIYAVISSQILEASLGQLINPLFFMILGAVFLKERLNLVAKFSVFLAFVAIVIQIYSLGTLPVITIALPASFAVYGLLKKRLHVPSLEGLFVETMLYFPVVLFYIVYVGVSGNGSFGLNLDSLFLLFTGVVTILPLITFNIAAGGLSLSAIGFLYYITPTTGIFLAVFVYGESLDGHKIASFALIWIGIFMVTMDQMLARRKRINTQ